MDVYVSLRRWGKRVLLATCDADILGKTLRQGNIVFQIHEKFYKGSLVTLEEAIDLIQQSTIINMVGHRIVKKAMEKGLVQPAAVLEIEGIPHALIVKS